MLISNITVLAYWWKAALHRDQNLLCVLATYFGRACWTQFAHILGGGWKAREGKVCTKYLSVHLVHQSIKDLVCVIKVMCKVLVLCDGREMMNLGGP